MEEGANTMIEKPFVGYHCPCLHPRFVNAGFAISKMACADCGMLQEDIRSEMELALALAEANEPSFQHDMTAIRLAKIPVLRGFGEISALCSVAAEHGAVVAGGFARFCCSPSLEPGQPNDIDVFPPDAAAAKGVAAAVMERGFRKMHESAFSVSLRHSSPGMLLERPETARWATTRTIQVIKPEAIAKAYGIDPSSAGDVIRSFDSPIVRVAILDHETALADERFWKSELSRDAVFEGMRSIGQLACRVVKYRKKGYQTSLSQEMMEALEATDRHYAWERLKEAISDTEFDAKQVMDHGNSDSGAACHPRSLDSRQEALENRVQTCDLRGYALVATADAEARVRRRQANFRAS
jgi:hypothetical protein